MRKILFLMALIITSCSQISKVNNDISTNSDNLKKDAKGLICKIIDGKLWINDFDVSRKTNLDEIKKEFGMSYSEDEIPGYKIIQYLEKGLSFNFSTNDFIFRGVSLYFRNNVYAETALESFKFGNLVLLKNSSLNLIEKNLIENKFEDQSMSGGSKRRVFKQVTDSFEIYVSFNRDGLVSKIDYVEKT